MVQYRIWMIAISLTHHSKVHRSLDLMAQFLLTHRLESQEKVLTLMQVVIENGCMTTRYLPL